jgi:hypothetical protein
VTLILVIILLLILLGGGPVVYANRADWGYGPGGVVGLLVFIILVILVLRLCGVWV